MSKNRKIYSPDIISYSFDGKMGLFKTISYILVSPIRLVTRVMHNIFVMPADAQAKYAEGLLVVAILTALLGAADFYLNGKWVLIVSQLPLVPVAMLIKKAAIASKNIAKEKRKIEIDTEQVSNIVSTVYDELNDLMED